MGFVDLWTGIGGKLRSPEPLCGIAAFVEHGKPCLEVACLRMNLQPAPRRSCYRYLDGWSVTTWSSSNRKMSGSYEEWHEDFTVRASEIKISAAASLQLRGSGLLLQRKPSRDGDEGELELALQIVTVSEPSWPGEPRGSCLPDGQAKVHAAQGTLLCLPWLRLALKISSGLMGRQAYHSTIDGDVECLGE
ncbi:hypothetical protein ACP4OV_021501 [Aristida adscensionis]